MPDHKTLIISALVCFKSNILAEKSWKLEPVSYFSAVQRYDLNLKPQNINAKKYKKSPFWRLFILFIKFFVD